MIRLTLPLLVVTALFATPGFAQSELPYHQQQRLVVIFNVPETLQGVRPDGSTFHVLDRGTYRFDALQQTQAVQTPANFLDGTGPFTRFGRSLVGRIRPLSGLGTTRDATVDLRLTEADFARENVVRAGEVGFRFRVQLGPMTSTAVRYAGDVRPAGAFVGGSLANVVTLPPQPGSIEVWHTKLVLEDHLPIRRPLEDFPPTIMARVRPTPLDQIEAGPYDFSLTRDELNEVGAVWYDADAQFPMVEESDPYGDYRSGPYRAQLVLREDGKTWIRLAWGLTGRYHGWNFNYVGVLEPDEYEQLLRDGSLTVTGSARYAYDDELQRFSVESPAEIDLTVQPTTAPGMTAAISPN